MSGYRVCFVLQATVTEPCEGGGDDGVASLTGYLAQTRKLGDALAHWLATSRLHRGHGYVYPSHWLLLRVRKIDPTAPTQEELDANLAWLLFVPPVPPTARRCTVLSAEGVSLRGVAGTPEAVGACVGAALELLPVGGEARLLIEVAA